MDSLGRELASETRELPAPFRKRWIVFPEDDVVATGLWPVPPQYSFSHQGRRPYRAVATARRCKYQAVDICLASVSRTTRSISRRAEDCAPYLCCDWRCKTVPPCSAHGGERRPVALIQTESKPGTGTVWYLLVKNVFQPQGARCCRTTNNIGRQRSKACAIT